VVNRLKARRPDDAALEDPLAGGQRTRAALMLLLLGVTVLLVALGIAVLRGQPQPEEMIGAGGPPGPERLGGKAQAMVATVTLLYGTILIVVFVVAAVALVAVSRGYRRRLQATRPAPTAYDDVWSRHKLPEEPDPAAGPPADDP
jgi:ABC-type Fe3+ transport system permease subunit